MAKWNEPVALRPAPPFMVADDPFDDQVARPRTAGEELAPEPDWIEWDGGECPVPEDACVDVRFRGGDTDERSRAGMWSWNTGCNNYDIIAYRLSSKQD